MNLVRTQFDRIQSQLLALSPSQKMLTASLLTIMVMTLFYWVHYAATPEYAPVLDQSLSSEDAGQIASFLRDHDYDVRVSGDRVLVPADKQMQAVSELAFAQKMPQNISDGFDVIVKQMNAFDSADKDDVMWNHATELTVAGVISRWAGVAGASVVIDKTSKQGMSFEDTIQPSAAVNIQMRDTAKVDRKLADAAVRFLTGAVAGLAPANVHVIINGVPMNTDSGDGLGAADRILEVQRDQEKYLTDKITNNLAYMGAPVYAEVTCQVDNQSVSTEQTAIDSKGSLYKPLKEETTSDQTNSGQAAPAEPGVGANIQANIASAAPKNTSTKSEETDEYTLVPAQTLTKSIQTPGKVTVQTAAVQLPRSYFLASYKQENPGAKDPDAATLQAIIEKQMPDIKGAIRGCTGLADDAINVSLYDPITTDSSPQTVAIAGAGESSGVSSMVGTHAKDIAVAALAMISLFMVSMMVRKGTPQPIPQIPQEKPEPPTLESGEMVAGEAGDGNPLLDGMELDDDAIKTQQMIGQVSQMVKDNPEGAANLVKRWLNHA